MARPGTPTITIGDDDPRHGTANGYGNRRCRCDGCKAAHIEDETRRAVGKYPHGSDGRYSFGRCRCQVCRYGHAIASNIRWHGGKAPATVDLTRSY